MTAAPASADWQRPLQLVTGSILVVVVSMVLLDMGPQTVLVAAFGAFIGATLWCVRSLSQTQPLPMPTSRAVAAPRASGADARVRSLRTSILFGRVLDGHSGRLHETLVTLIDDQLAHAHGIDRSSEPDAAAAVIGPQLATFVSDPEAAASIGSTKQLQRIVTLIEKI